MRGREKRESAWPANYWERYCYCYYCRRTSATRKFYLISDLISQHLHCKLVCIMHEYFNSGKYILRSQKDNVDNSRSSNTISIHEDYWGTFCFYNTIGNFATQFSNFFVYSAKMKKLSPLCLQPMSLVFFETSSETRCGHNVIRLPFERSKFGRRFQRKI